MFRLFWHIFWSMTGAVGFFGVDMSPSSQENQQYGQLTQASGFATGTGEANISAGSAFMRDVLSGDPTKIATALAPQISQQQQMTQQGKKTMAEFGTRSGGTAAAGASADATGRSNLINLTGDLTGKAASNLLTSGEGLLSSGMSGSEAGFNEAKTMQEQRASAFNDIFKSATSIGAGILGAIPGDSGGFADVGSNILGSAS